MCLNIIIAVIVTVVIHYKYTAFTTMYSQPILIVYSICSSLFFLSYVIKKLMIAQAKKYQIYPRAGDWIARGHMGYPGYVYALPSFFTLLFSGPYWKEHAKL
jgi:hypothetical protein